MLQEGDLTKEKASVISSLQQINCVSVKIKADKTNAGYKLVTIQMKRKI